MTFPYRIVWHSYDPRATIAPIGPGERTDMITIQRLLRRPPVPAAEMSHVIYFDYNLWHAEFFCIYDEARDRIEEVIVKRTNAALRACLATPAELASALHERLTTTQARDPAYFNMFMERGPIDMRMMPQKDDAGHRFIEIAILCTSFGHGPEVVRFAGKQWSVNMTEEEELLTNDERRRLEIDDSDWRIWAGQDPDEDNDDAGANQNQ